MSLNSSRYEQCNNSVIYLVITTVFVYGREIKLQLNKDRGDGNRRGIYMYVKLKTVYSKINVKRLFVYKRTHVNKIK